MKWNMLKHYIESSAQLIKVISFTIHENDKSILYVIFHLTFFSHF